MTLRKSFLPKNEIFRFTAVALCGLAVDISVAWILAVPFGVLLWLAATVGFLCGAMINYILHEMWTFRDGAGRLSARRSTVYFGALAVTFIVRLTTIELLHLAFTPKGNELLILALATSVSFFTNYTLSKFVVFKSASTQGSISKDRPDE